MKGINTNKKITAAIYAVMIMLVTTTVAIGVYDFNIKTGTVTVEDKSEEVKTKKVTVEELLKEQNITLEDNDYINVSKKAKIEKEFDIKIRRAVPISVNFKGSEKNIKTANVKVKDVLKSQSITYDKDDKITPALDSKVVKDMKIKVIQYEEKMKTVEEEIGFQTQAKENGQLEKGKTLTVQEGVKGLKQNTVKEVYENGKLMSTQIIATKVVKEPVVKIVQNGTKVNEVKVASRGGSGSQVAPTGNKSLQGARSVVMNATAYDISFESCGKNPGDPYYGITATGTKVGPGVVAVDPKVIPLGSKLYIESMDGTGSYGYASAEDKGGAIKGNRIDLFFSTKGQVDNFGRRQVKVYILN